MHLACSRRCGGELFRALFAEIDLDAGGELQEFRISQPGYICLNCGAPAFDLALVPGQMDADAEEDTPAPATTDILCPVCETMVQVGTEMECPNCGTPLEAA